MNELMPTSSKRYPSHILSFEQISFWAVVFQCLVFFCLFHIIAKVVGKVDSFAG